MMTFLNIVLFASLVYLFFRFILISPTDAEDTGIAPVPPIGGAALPKMRMLLGGAPARALVGRKSHRPRKGNVVSRSGGMMTFVSGSRTWRLPESRLVA